MSGLGGSPGLESLCRADIRLFAEWCFGLEAAWFHRDWYDTVSNPLVTSALTIAPRNSAKSTIWAKIAPLWLLGNNPDLRILLVSRTSSLARTNLRFIRRQVESNDRVRRVFPNLLQDSPWGEDMLTVVNNRNDGHASVNAVGLGGTITGVRADLIIVDDLIDKNNVMTDGQRIKVNEFWDETVTPTLNPDGRIFLIGTRYHAKDFYSRMLQDPMYRDNTFTFPALELDERGEYKLDEKGEMISYWPERWPVEKLMEMKERMGSLAFASQYMCDPSGYEGRLFSPDWIHFYDPDKDLLPKLTALDFYMFVDPNITADPKSDNTAIVTGAVDRRYKTLYVMDIFAKPLDIVDQSRVVARYGNRNQVRVGSTLVDCFITRIGIESNAYQRALQRSGYAQGLPVVEVKHQANSKEVRIMGMAPHIENGRVLFPDPATVKTHWWDSFYEEYCTFPRGRRDDRMDGLEGLIEISGITNLGSTIPHGPSGSSLRRHRW